MKYENLVYLVCLAGAVIYVLFVKYLTRPRYARRTPVAISPEEQDMLRALEGLNIAGRRAYSLCCCQRLHNFPHCGESPEHPEVVRWRQEVLAALWAELETGDRAPITEFLKEVESFLPKEGECPTCHSNNVYKRTGCCADDERLYPLLYFLDVWDSAEPQHARTITVSVRNYIDQIVMDDLVVRHTFQPSETLAGEIVGGVAWKTHQGLQSHPLMRLEHDNEYSDLAMLAQTPKVADAVGALRTSASKAWDSADIR